MIKHVWSLVCKETKIEQGTNNISVIDEYESIQFDLTLQNKEDIDKSPLITPFNFELVSLFFRDKKGTVESLEEIVEILDPKGQMLGEFNTEIKFEEDQNRVRNILKFNMIALSSSGTYIFQVHTLKKDKTKKDLVAAIPVDITVTLDGNRK